MGKKFKTHILCIGAGYVGGPTMAMIAFKCPMHKVTVVDINRKKIDQWNSDRLPIYEPGLDEIVQKARGRNLFFSADIDKGIEDADIIFVSVNTPTKSYGQGAGMAPDLRYWEATARRIRETARSPKIIVEKSTIPVRTAQAMERILSSGNRGIRFDVLSNPEFLAEGTAMRDLENPDRIVIGSRRTPEGLKAMNELADVYAQWMPRDRILTVDVWSSELSKLASNAFLAQRISSINAISQFCEETGADVAHVAAVIGKDSRIGDKFLNASVGFGGSCFKKDILSLVYLCRHHGLDDAADYWESVVSMNEVQKDRFVTKMLNAMFNTLAGKKICVLGFAFKADTGDTRQAPAIAVVKKLAEEKARVVISDPRALENAQNDLKDVDGDIRYVEDPMEAAKGASAIALLTEWDMYRVLDYKKIFESMEKPAFFFDGRNIADHRALYDMGFNVFPTGRPALSHFS
ncbi:Nucleotide sugar dehydrogenase [Candidatus Desulfarcum epimagneticum]|uniref:UDP-glucose 6-dehydrogenase n=1 Tax=uncultured Desulfobacteraceae bacterium TaxID=218296 RepID=A0A484HGX7_9BACT|nr:Nucleotide sugar dehydrogenase [uncultured Desulfobacteraceae bacterium]